MFGIFKTKAIRRASERSSHALQAAWIGPPFTDYVQQHASAFEQKYQETLGKCNVEEPIDVLNGVIDGSMTLFISGNDSARTKVLSGAISESDGYTLSGSFTMLGLLGQIVFSHAPAVAYAEKQNPDRVCFDTVQCIQTSIINRAVEMHPDYAEGANVVLSNFLSNLFGED